MADVSSLLERIDAEFSAAEQSIKAFQQEEVAAHEAREQRQRPLIHSESRHTSSGAASASGRY
jgi:hypothetical protein